MGKTHFFIAAAICVSLAASMAHGEAIYSQTPASTVTAIASDRDFDNDGHQVAEDVTLTSADTARSVTWRGAIAGAGTTLPPISFDLIFYGSNANLLPDENNILSSTTVSFAAGEFTDTGFDVATFNVYEFRADLTPTALPAATRVWFSVLADTSNDADDNFHWTSSASGGASSFRADVSGDAAFVLDASGPFYFILDNALIPEPAGLSLLALAALPLRRRRR